MACYKQGLFGPGSMPFFGIAQGYKCFCGEDYSRFSDSLAGKYIHCTDVLSFNCSYDSFIDNVIACGNDDIDCEGSPSRKCGSKLQDSFVTIYDTNPDLEAQALKIYPTRRYHFWIQGIKAVSRSVDVILPESRSQVRLYLFQVHTYSN